MPTVDHAFITPKGNRVMAITDDGAVAGLGTLHINGVIEYPIGA